MSGLELSRRTVIKAAAWSTPVLALTVAAPTTAASTGTLLAYWDQSEVTASMVYIYGFDDYAIGVNTGFSVTNMSDVITPLTLSTAGLSTQIQAIDVGPGLFWSANEESSGMIKPGQTIHTRVNFFVDAPQGTIDQTVTIDLRSDLYPQITPTTASIRIRY